MKKSLPRRLFLRGTGSVLISLPWLPELTPANAQAIAAPVRVLTMSFGLGLARNLFEERYAGVLQNFEPIHSKAAYFPDTRNDDLADGKSALHRDVGTSLFTGKKQVNENQAGGPSLEQMFKLGLHPNGVPTATGIPSIAAGMWSRTGSTSQYVRHWNENGSPGDVPERRPSRTFDTLFGSFMAPTPTGAQPDPEMELERRIRRSVLDSVNNQAAMLTGDRSYLGIESKNRIAQHLQNLRDVELQLVGADVGAIAAENAGCKVPARGEIIDPEGVSFYDAPSGDNTGPEVDWKAAQAAFRLNGELIALGFACDAVRFASMVYAGAGEHLRFRGVYEALGDSVDFALAMDKESAHNTIFHAYNEREVRLYQHYVVSNLAYVLTKLDQVVEADGRTLLDNSVGVITTEFGRNHETQGGIFHGVFGGTGKLKPGEYTGNYRFADVYSSLMKAYGVPNNLDGQIISEFLA